MSCLGCEPIGTIGDISASDWRLGCEASDDLLEITFTTFSGERDHATWQVGLLYGMAALDDTQCRFTQAAIADDVATDLVTVRSRTSGLRR